MKKTYAPVLLLAALLLLALPVSASSNAPKLVGAWLVSVTDDATGEEATSAYTFGRRGAMSASVDLENVTTGHGAWERIAPRTFATTFVSFIPDNSSSVPVISKNTAIFHVSQGGHDASVELRFEIIVNGTVVASGSAQGSGVRIYPEPF